MSLLDAIAVGLASDLLASEPSVGHDNLMPEQAHYVEWMQEAQAWSLHE